MKKSNIILTGAGLTIIIAGMKIASSILVPFLLAGFIAILTAPILLFLQNKKIPRGIAVLMIVLLLVILGGSLSTLLGTSIKGFSSRIPFYTERVYEQSNWVIGLAGDWGIDIPKSTVEEYFDPGTAIKIIGKTLTGLRSVLTNTFLIILTVIFILLEASGIPKKIKKAFKQTDEGLAPIKTFFASFNHYLIIKTCTSLATGVLIFLWLTFFNIDFPVLWGLLAFMLNFVPNVGSIIAAIPAILIAIIQLGFMDAGIILLGYVAVNITLGSLLEPRLLGKGLGLSPLIVFLSLVFWGWVLGPVGMLLSVPLTMIAKIAMENNEGTKWISILMGSESEI